MSLKISRQRTGPGQEEGVRLGVGESQRRNGFSEGPHTTANSGAWQTYQLEILAQLQDLPVDTDVLLI